MKSKLINEDTQRTFALILDQGDDVTSCIMNFAKKENLSAAQFTGIGAFKEALLGFFDFEKRNYKEIKIAGQTEVLSMIGDITMYRNEPQMHAHVVLGKPDGTAHGGHLLEATTNPTLELILTESPAYLRRQMDDRVGIPLIVLD